MITRIFLFAMLMMLGTEQLRAEEQLSWIQKFIQLRFGPEKKVIAKDGFVDLTGLAADEYWSIGGNVFFFPGEWIDPVRLQENLNRPETSAASATWFELNHKGSRQAKGPQVSNVGSFALCFRNVVPGKYSLAMKSVYHGLRIHLVDSRRIATIGQYATLNLDPALNQDLYDFRYPSFAFEAQDDFCLLFHASAAVTGIIQNPSLSGLFFGTESIINESLKINLTAVGIVIGAFAVSCLFYAFIFVLRPYDRSSLHLSMFALSSFIMSCLAYLRLPINRTEFATIFSITNIISISFLGFFILSKVNSYLSVKNLKTLHGLVMAFAAVGIVLQFAGSMLWWALYSIVLQLFNIFLIGLGIRLGLRHRISGFGFFIAGAIIMLGIESTVVRIIVLQVNEDWGYGIILANLAMTLALALVNAKEFAVTFRESEMLRQEQDRLLSEIKDKEQARTLFFQNTSHELRTPLNGIIGFMKLVVQNKYGPIPAEAVAQLQKCVRLAVSLKNQVNTILDLAKSKKGNLTLQNSAFDLEELASEAEDLASGLLLKREDFSFQLEKKWNHDQRQFVGDREKISAVLRNLIGNAFKFCDPVRANHVRLSLQRHDASLLIHISDTGIGIAAEDQGRIFEEFQQLAGDARRAYEGTGLGLTMVRDFVRLMGGTIRLESEVGRGSHFILDIPQQTQIHLQHQPDIAASPVSSVEKAKDSGGTAAGAESMAGMQARIMVIDDNELNCEVLKDLLESEGFHVRTMLDGREALKWMHREHPDLVLLDMMMPFFSGEDVIKAMQADNQLRDIPVILVTARASEDDRLFGLSLGADDYLAKPIHHEELLFRVKNMLHRIDVHRKITAAEEGHKLAQLGQLMRELSHEMKNVFQMESFRVDQIPLACESILKRLPLESEAWPLAARAISNQHYLPAEKVKVHGLSVRSPEQSQSKLIRSIRASLALLDIEESARADLWQVILSLPEPQQIEVEQTLYIIRNFRLMQDQTTYIRDLVHNILEFARSGEARPTASIRSALERVLSLLRHRIQKSAIKVILPSHDVEVCISQSHLMQVLLNLCINACDAIENLDMEQRFIAFEIIPVEQRLEFILRNGGQPFTPEQADQILTEEWTSKGSKGYGLGLGISLRLIQRAGGNLEARANGPGPEFRITLNLAANGEERKIA